MPGFAAAVRSRWLDTRAGALRTPDPAQSPASPHNKAREVITAFAGLSLHKLVEVPGFEPGSLQPSHTASTLMCWYLSRRCYATNRA